MFPGENRDWIICYADQCWFTCKLYGTDDDVTEGTTAVFMYDPKGVSRRRAQMFGQYFFTYEEAVTWVDKLNLKGRWINIGKTRGSPIYGKKPSDAINVKKG